MLAATVSKVERLSHQVTDAGNPIQVDQSIAYTLKGIGTRLTFHSKINIYIDPATGKTERVEDRWDSTLPNGSLSEAHLRQLINPFWWLYYTVCWVWWAWSFIWWTPLWEVCLLIRLPVFEITAQKFVDGQC
jgi:hypothetical protein